jgi:hypothetical protein
MPANVGNSGDVTAGLRRRQHQAIAQRDRVARSGHDPAHDRISEAAGNPAVPQQQVADEKQCSVNGQLSSVDQDDLVR